ncbi:MAG: riboflavin synthase [Actinomycetota bacterium]|nr:riboflavin synthase [Actinomycetota bacterium]
MFTGIIEEVGRVERLERSTDRARLEVGCHAIVPDLSLGASIAVDGCCLTVAAVTPTGFAADLMAETLRATALGDLDAGGRVNLERALAADGRFGGHLLQGHVDAVGSVLARDDQPGTVTLTIAAPAAIAPLVARKGSVAVAGVSLTVIDVDDRDGDAAFRVGLIPHTCASTTLGDARPGDRVNLEADVLARYVQRLCDGRTT